MIGVFERSSLVFLAGAVVLAMGAAVLWRSPESPEPVVAALPTETRSASNEPVAEARPEPDAARFSYDLEAVAAGAPVPRVFASSLPEAEATGSDVKGEEIAKAVLPLALLVNEEILAERKHLWSIRFKLKRGDPVPAEQRIWLGVVADRYAADADDLDELGRRVDAAPPSIILAVAEDELNRQRQQAVETARKAANREKSAGMARGASGGASSTHLSEDEPNKTVANMTRSPLELVRALVRELNTVPAYQSFRSARADMRLTGRPLDGLRLAAALPNERRSQLRGDHIVGSITARRLDRFDTARLQSSPSG
jgi:Bax protein